MGSLVDIALKMYNNNQWRLVIANGRSETLNMKLAHNSNKNNGYTYNGNTMTILMKMNCLKI